MTSPVSYCKVCIQPIAYNVNQAFKANDLCGDRCMNQYLCSVHIPSNAKYQDKQIKSEYKDISFKAEMIDKSTQTSIDHRIHSVKNKK